MLKLYSTVENVVISLMSIRNILEFYSTDKKVYQDNLQGKFFNETLTRLDNILSEIEYLVSTENFANV